MPTMREQILEHVKEHQFGSGTFKFNDRTVYEYLLGDWKGVQNAILVVWCPDKPLTEFEAQEANLIVCEIADSMLDVEKTRRHLKKEASKWPEPKEPKEE